MYSHVTTDFYCHIWEHWALKRISPLNCSFFLLVCITMLILWVHKCENGVLEITRDTKVLSSHSSSTRDLRLLYHLWFPKPHTHISYLQYFHIARNNSHGKRKYFFTFSNKIAISCFAIKEKKISSVLYWSRHTVAFLKLFLMYETFWHFLNKNLWIYEASFRFDHQIIIYQFS